MNSGLGPKLGPQPTPGKTPETLKKPKSPEEIAIEAAKRAEELKKQLPHGFFEMMLLDEEVIKVPDPEKQGKFIYKIKRTGEIINDLPEFIEKLLTKKEYAEEIRKTLQTFNEFLDTLKDTEKREKLRQFVRTKSSEREVPSSLSQTAESGAVFLEREGPNKYKVNPNAKDVTVSYAEVIPIALVKIIIITRMDADGEVKKLVCVNYEKGNQKYFIDFQSGTPVYLQSGDIITVAEVTKGAEAKDAAKRVAENVATNQKTEPRVVMPVQTASLRKTRPSRTAVTDYGRTVTEPRVPSSRSSVSQPTQAPTPTASSKPRQVEAPATAEGEHLESPAEFNGMCDQLSFKLPGKLYGSILMHKGRGQFQGPPTIITYFPGRGSYKVFESWNKKHWGQPPPPEVVAQAAREDFFDSDKNFFNMLKERWARGENVVFVWMCNSRQELGRGDKEEGKHAKYWYNAFYNAGMTNDVFRNIKEKLLRTIDPSQQKNPQELLEQAKYLYAGHSMGGKAMSGLADLIAKGQFQPRFGSTSTEVTEEDLQKVAFSENDNAYWSKDSAIRLAKRGLTLKLTYRPGSPTEANSRSVIASLNLKPHKQGSRTVYTSEKYPNVTVTETSLGHGAHAGLLAEALPS